MKKLNLKSIIEAGLVVLAVLSTAAEAQSLSTSYLCDVQVKTYSGRVLLDGKDMPVVAALVSSEEDDEVPGAEVLQDFSEKLQKTVYTSVKLTAKFNGSRLVLGLGHYNKMAESKIFLTTVAAADPNGAPVKLLSQVRSDARMVYSCRAPQ